MGATIINTHDQLTAARGGIAIVKSPARSLIPRRWFVYRVDERGIENPTDLSPECKWYDYNRKAFLVGVGGSGAVAGARIAAQRWVAENLGEAGPWVRNRLGDYVPLRINKQFPVTPREKAVLKPELRDGAWKP